MVAKMTAEHADQDGRDEDDADGAVGAVLEAARLERDAAAGPGGAGARAGGGEDDRAAAAGGEDEVLADGAVGAAISSACTPPRAGTRSPALAQVRPATQAHRARERTPGRCGPRGPVRAVAVGQRPGHDPPRQLIPGQERPSDHGPARPRQPAARFAEPPSADCHIRRNRRTMTAAAGPPECRYDDAR
jgi:hypothetical protein